MKQDIQGPARDRRGAQWPAVRNRLGRGVTGRSDSARGNSCFVDRLYAAKIPHNQVHFMVCRGDRSPCGLRLKKD